MSGSDVNSVRVWDASTGLELMELKGHTRSVNSVAFSSDGTRIVSGSSDKFVRVWDASTGAELKELKEPKGLTIPVNLVASLSKGPQIGSGLEDTSVLVGCEHFAWNLAHNSWIISSQGQDHLMWVPPEAQLLRPFDKLIISCSGFATVDFHQSLIGVEWVHCYIP